MQPIKNLFGQKRILAKSERAELIGYFHEKLSKGYESFMKKPLTPSFLAFKLSHLNKGELYYLKSVCDDSEKRGYSFSKKFWYEITPHDE